MSIIFISLLSISRSNNNCHSRGACLMDIVYTATTNNKHFTPVPASSSGKCEFAPRLVSARNYRTSNISRH